MPFNLSLIIAKYLYASILFSFWHHLTTPFSTFWSVRLWFSTCKCPAVNIILSTYLRSKYLGIIVLLEQTQHIAWKVGKHCSTIVDGFLIPFQYYRKVIFKSQHPSSSQCFKINPDLNGWPIRKQGFETWMEYLLNYKKWL